jgi:hypothetical protein
VLVAWFETDGVGLELEVETSMEVNSLGEGDAGFVEIILTVPFSARN